MKLHFGSKTFGTRLSAAILSAAVLLTTTVVSAQTPPYEKAVLELLLESRSQKPADQATAQEIQAAIDELENIYAVTDHPRAIELGNAPDIKAQIELQRRAVLFNAFATDFFAQNQATEQEIFNTYEEQVAIAPPKEFKARHILVETQGAAIALIEELQNGADFVALAKEKSIGPSGPSGGDLGWFAAPAMVKPFSEAVAVLEDGAFTVAPVQTQFGWHVILREESRDGVPPPLDSVRDVLKQRVEQQKLQDFMSNLRAKPAD